MATPDINDCDIRNAGLAYVLLKGNNGSAAKHPSARNVCYGLDLDLSLARIDPDLHLCIFGRIAFGIQRLVGSVSLYLDCSLGNNYGIAEKNAKVALLCGISGCVLSARI